MKKELERKDKMRKNMKIIRLLLVTLSVLTAYTMGRYKFSTIVEVLGLISTLVMVNVECYLICEKE